jgi:hypothetical protein
MKKNELKETAASYMQAWSAGNQDLLDKYADKNLVIYYPHFEKPFSGLQNANQCWKQPTVSFLT